MHRAFHPEGRGRQNDSNLNRDAAALKMTKTIIWLRLETSAEVS
jgi:hypothetical protein